MSALGTGNGGAEITFTLSARATVQADVLHIAGLAVQRPVTNRVLTAGTNSLHWNGRSISGMQVLVGRYVIRITASSEDGQQLSRIGTVNIKR